MMTPDDMQRLEQQRILDGAELIARHPDCPEKPSIARDALRDVEESELNEETKQKIRDLLSPFVR